MDAVPDHLMADIAKAAARSWNTDGSPPELVKNRENAIFRIKLESGADAALRIHRLGYHDDTALRSELQWMAALGDAGLSVPRPIAAKNGVLLVTCGDTRAPGERHADVLQWLGGAPLGETGKPLGHSRDRLSGIFAQVGAAMAKLHGVSDRWRMPNGFRRHAWDQDGLLGETPFWGRFWENENLSPDQRTTISAARKRAVRDLAAYARTGDYGLIHADLVRENILVDGNRIHLIDFDDAGFGWRIFDIATALHRNRSEPDYPLIRDALISGYRSERGLRDDDIAALPLFLLLRGFTYLGWIMTRMSERDAEIRLRRFIKTAVSDSEAYLDDRQLIDMTVD